MLPASDFSQLAKQTSTIIYAFQEDRRLLSKETRGPFRASMLSEIRRRRTGPGLFPSPFFVALMFLPLAKKPGKKLRGIERLGVDLTEINPAVLNKRHDVAEVEFHAAEQLKR